jgi:hypothetical protein
MKDRSAVTFAFPNYCDYRISIESLPPGQHAPAPFGDAPRPDYNRSVLIMEQPGAKLCLREGC